MGAMVTSIGEIHALLEDRLETGFSAQIHPDAFADRMDRHWTDRLGNVSSDVLKEVWRQLCEAFNANISSHDDPKASRKWTVLQPPTGSGKTQGLIVYCSMLSELPPENHPGVLIVTRFKADADSIAEQINEMSGMEVAASHHSDTEETLSDVQDYPVLVITHSAYLNSFGSDVMGRSKRKSVTQWRDSERRLVVIDEALDIVVTKEVVEDELKQTLAAIPREIQEKHPKEIRVIKAAIEMFEQAGERGSDAVLWREKPMLYQQYPQRIWRNENGDLVCTVARHHLVDKGFNENGERGYFFKLVDLRVYLPSPPLPSLSRTSGLTTRLGETMLC